MDRPRAAPAPRRPFRVIVLNNLSRGSGAGGKFHNVTFMITADDESTDAALHPERSYAKVFLPGIEKTYTESGRDDRLTIESPHGHGRVGFLTCYDYLFPSLLREYAMIDHVRLLTAARRGDRCGERRTRVEGARPSWWPLAFAGPGQGAVAVRRYPLPRCRQHATRCAPRGPDEGVLGLNTRGSRDAQTPAPRRPWARSLPRGPSGPGQRRRGRGPPGRRRPRGRPRWGRPGDAGPRVAVGIGEVPGARVPDRVWNTRPPRCGKAPWPPARAGGTMAMRRCQQH